MTTICFDSGVCETVIVVGGIVVGVAAITYLAYDALSKPKPKAKPSPNGPKCGKSMNCEMQYAADVAVCKALGSRACYAQAAERYAACLAGRPMPPFPFGGSQ